MFYFRKDPISKKIANSYFKNKKLKFSSFEEVQNLVDKCREDNNRIDSLSFSMIMKDEFPDNIRSWLNCFDDLVALGFYYDAEILITKKITDSESLYSESPHPLCLERLYDLLIDQYEYNRSNDLIFKYIEIVRFNQRLIGKLQKNLLLFGDFENYNLFIRLGFWGGVEDLKFTGDDNLEVEYYKSLLRKDVQECSRNCYRLYSSGNRSKSFLKNAVKLLNGETISSRRFLFFTIQAYRDFPNEVDFLIAFCKTQMFLGFYEKVYNNIIFLDLKRIIIYGDLSYKSKNDLYYIYLKLSSWLGYSKDCLLSYEEAVKSDVINPFSLDLMNKGSVSINNDGDVPSELQQVSQNLKQGSLIRSTWKDLKNIYADNISREGRLSVFFSGQIRGSNESIGLFNKYKNLLSPDFSSCSIWSRQSLSPPKNNINRYFVEKIIKSIPVEYRSIEVLRKKFPNLIGSIENIPELEMNESKFSLLGFSKFHMESSIDFEQSKQQGFSIRGKLNQAKMFYKMFSVGFDSISNEDVVVRLRVDMDPDFRININEFVKYLQKEKSVSYLYTNYFGPAGSLGDQFWISDGLGFKKMSLLWQSALKEKKLVYADFFDEYAKHHAAEDLCIMQAIATGVNLSYIKSENNPKFLTPDVRGYLDLSNCINKDKINLSSQDIEVFKDFINCFKHK